MKFPIQLLNDIIMGPSILRQQGFTWLELPRENLLPLMLLEKVSENIFRRLWITVFNGSLSANALNASVFDLFPKPKQGLIPRLNPPQAASFFNGYDILDVSTGADFSTGGQLPLLDGSAASSLKKASKLLYTFSNIIHLTIDNDVQLEEHLNITSPRIQAPGFFQKLNSGDLFVVVEVLQTTCFSVHDASDFRIDSEINLEKVQQYVDLKTKFQHEKESSQEVSYSGARPVTFAVKAYNILYDEKNSKYTLLKKELRKVRSSFESQADYVMFPLEPILLLE